jgi:type II secretory pathway component GspD/PulD (secretin)
MMKSRKLLLVCTVASVLAGCSVYLYAQGTVLRARPKRLREYELPGMATTVTLTTLEPWDVVQLIEFLAYKGGLKNIVIGQGVAGLTTKLKFEKVAVGEALELVLSVNKLAYKVEDGILEIMTDEEYRLRRGVSFYDNKQVMVVDLKYADPVHVAQILGSMKSDAGTVVSDAVTGSLILIDTPEKIAEMQPIVAKADIPTVSRVMPTETKAFALQYAALEDVREQVQSLLSESAGEMRADQRTKTLIVTALPHNMKRVSELIALFDRRPKQVFIEAKIVQVSLGDQYKLGVDWDHVFQSVDPRFSLSTAVRPKIEGAEGIVEPGSGIGSLSYRTILGGGDLALIVDALKSVGETKILSNPHVAVLDGEEATIKVITDRPYAEAQLETGTTNVVGETIKFIEVGVTLQVTPRINDKGLIGMSIRPEVSSVLGDYQAFREVPIVRRSYAETSVLVKDQETIIIAGMIENTKEDSESSVPFLGRVPLLGLLFRSTSEVIRADETVVFLSPRVVTGDEPYLLMRDLKKRTKPLRTVGEGMSTELRPLR